MTLTEDVKIKIANAHKANPYADITPYELGIAFPFVSYIGFHPLIVRKCGIHIC